MTILVTGGTGTLGRHVVGLLSSSPSDHDLRVLSRGRREPVAGVEHVVADLVRDDGIAAAVEGADVVLHLAGGPKGDDVATAHLVRAARAASVGHLVLISVIAADRMPIGYFRAKHGAERAVAEGDVPWTILRAAQFHDLVAGLIAKLLRSPVLPLPGAVRLQPVDTAAVAARLAELALAPPAGVVPDLAGPEIRPLTDLARAALRARDKRRAIAPVPLPPKLARLYRDGANLTLEAETAGASWDAFLARAA
jgi:uncharacterized protein YbjT (DUF2867 family)